VNKKLVYGFILVILALALVAILAPGPGIKPDQGQSAVYILLLTQQADWNKGDIGAFMNGYWNSPDLTFAGPNGFTQGWQPVLERYQKTYASRAAMGMLQFSDLNIQMLGSDAALVRGKWHLQRHAGDIGGIFTLVLRRFPEGWRIIHDHTTQISPEPN